MICTKCNVNKDTTDFYFRRYKEPKGESLGCYRKVCNSCNSIRMKKYKSDESESKDRTLKSTYGITLETFKNMREFQGNKCAICGGSEKSVSRSGEIRQLSIDHDHETGKVRSLLCSHCNVAIGYLKDNPEIALSAYHYLKAHKEPFTTTTTP
ncbi:TPA: endonuclease VII domain-containing protein [Enterobacter cloacae]|nr:endonuclease VII domain-containing protein [Enterobacter cloacae]